MLCLHTAVSLSLSSAAAALCPPCREPRPADLATIAALEAEVGRLRRDVASYRSQLALLAPGAAPAPQGRPSQGRPRLPPLSSVGAGLPQFLPPASPVLATHGGGRSG